MNNKDVESDVSFLSCDSDVTIVGLILLAFHSLIAKPVTKQSIVTTARKLKSEIRRFIITSTLTDPLE